MTYIKRNTNQSAKWHARTRYNGQKEKNMSCVYYTFTVCMCAAVLMCLTSSHITLNQLLLPSAIECYDRRQDRTPYMRSNIFAETQSNHVRIDYGISLATPCVEHHHHHDHQFGQLSRTPNIYINICVYVCTFPVDFTIHLQKIHFFVR